MNVLMKVWFLTKPPEKQKTNTEEELQIVLFTVDCFVAISEIIQLFFFCFDTT